MAKTVTALYENYPTANSAVEDLVNHDFRRDDISILVQEALVKDGVLISKEETSGVATGFGIGAAIGGVGGLVLGLSALPLVAALVGAGFGAAAGGFIGILTDMDVPEEEAHYYAEGVRRGAVLVTVHAADDLAERAASVLATHHPIDLTQRVEEWRQSGWSGFDSDAEPSALAHSTPAHTRTPDKAYDSRERKALPLFLQAEHNTRTPDKAYDSKAHTVVTAAHQTREPEERTPTHDTAKETTIPVVEEALHVGKRQTERDVHVRTTVTETPVEETVRLRQEHVTVERRPVDRQVRPTDGEAFKEQTMTVTETGEESVVSKQARVVEEVVILKEAAEHIETVRDTVRRTDVQVDQTAGTAPQ
jgi:uncharacterized protein (TIGR02271 family)